MNAETESASELPVLFTAGEVAQRLAISRRTLEREIARGRVPPPLKIGRASRWPAADVRSYLERLARERGHSPAA